MNKELINKTRNWFLTINQEAECFSNVLDYLSNYDNCEYSAILHDKDNEEQPHYHVCILFKNARTFEQMKKRFKGAHIEEMESKYKCFRYLLHLDDLDKYQYDINEVVQRGNNVEYYSTHDEYIKLDTESVLEVISNGTLSNLLEAVKIFGIKQVNTYKNLIKELLDFKELKKDVVSKVDYERLTFKYNELYEDFEKISEVLEARTRYINELEETNNKLMLQIREYEKIIKERGLL